MFFIAARNSQPTSFRGRAVSHVLAVVAGIGVGQLAAGVDFSALLRRLAAPAAEASAAGGSEADLSGHVRAAAAATLDLQSLVKPIEITILDIERELRQAL